MSLFSFLRGRRNPEPTAAKTEGLQYDYQPDVDLLFVWVGAPQAAENIEVEPGIYVRVLPHARRVVGLEVLDCATRFRRSVNAINGSFARDLLDRYSPVALARL